MGDPFEFKILRAMVLNLAMNKRSNFAINGIFFALLMMTILFLGFANLHVNVLLLSWLLLSRTCVHSWASHHQIDDVAVDRLAPRGVRTFVQGHGTSAEGHTRKTSSPFTGKCPTSPTYILDSTDSFSQCFLSH